MKKFRRSTRFGLESLETREMLTSVPFGATSQDTSEFALGDVTVNVVFLESNGKIDANVENWTPELTSEVKENIEEGLQWWTDTLADYSDVHYLNFNVDYTFADSPVETAYEPISRGSQAFTLWIEDFFRAADVSSSSGFSTDIRTFNHQQRIKHDSNWSFTIFVVNADVDPNDRFGDANANGTVFERAFAYPGGQFIVMPHSRPASTVAHEVGHMFWAFDEYSGSDTYSARRGYYGTQNTNAFTGNPNPDDREPSLMASTSGPFKNQEISQSARETIGWKDSDGDGIFDVLDVNHTISGSIEVDEITRSLLFTGTSNVNTLNNRNTRGTGRDMTINRITDLQFRIDDGAWVDLAEYDDYRVSISAAVPIPNNVEIVQFRTLDDRSGVTSNIVTFDLPQFEPETDGAERDSEPIDNGTQDPAAVETGDGGEVFVGEQMPDEMDPNDIAPEDLDPEQPTADPATDPAPIYQNTVFPEDVNGDGEVSAVDALQVIIALNQGNHLPTHTGAPYLDVNGDSFVSTRDALAVINYINARTSPATDQATEQQTPETDEAVVEADPVVQTENVEADPETELAPTDQSSGRRARNESAATLAVWALFSSNSKRDSNGERDFWQ